MGNAQELERANTELYLVRKKMEKTVKKIRDLLQPREFDDLPFPDMKKILLKSIRQCEARIVDLQKRHPSMVKNWDKYYHDFSRMKGLLNKVKFRPDLTDTKVLDIVFKPPVLKKLDENFFAEFEDIEKQEGDNVVSLDEGESENDSGLFGENDGEEDGVEDGDEEEGESSYEEGDSSEEEGEYSEEEGEWEEEEEGELAQGIDKSEKT